MELFTEVWSQILTWAEEYSRCHSAYREIYKPGQAYFEPTQRSMLTDGENRLTHWEYGNWLHHGEYWAFALRLVCFGLLSGHTEQMSRVMDVLDYCNADAGTRDNLIECLVTPFTPGRTTDSGEVSLQPPYSKLLPIFTALPENRPALISCYLEERYPASREEPDFEQPDGVNIPFYGYWSWEAAAVTWLLAIDDTSYREHPNYPHHLVDYARQIKRSATRSIQNNYIPEIMNDPVPDIHADNQFPWKTWTNLEFTELKERVFQLMLLMSPWDETIVQKFFNIWCKELAEDEKTYGEDYDQDNFVELWTMSFECVLNSSFGFSIDARDDTFAARLDWLATHWNATINWFDEVSEDVFLDAFLNQLILPAYNQLHTQGYSLWILEEPLVDNSCVGWITRSSNDEIFLALAWLLELEVDPGNVSGWIR